MTLIATASLIIAVLFRFASAYRMPIAVIVSVAALVLAARSLFTGKIIWALLFMGVLGVFTPFRDNHFSGVLISTFDMASLALFALAPLASRGKVSPVHAQPGVVLNRPSFTPPNHRSS